MMADARRVGLAMLGWIISQVAWLGIDVERINPLATLDRALCISDCFFAKWHLICCQAYFKLYCFAFDEERTKHDIQF